MKPKIGVDPHKKLHADIKKTNIQITILAIFTLIWGIFYFITNQWRAETIKILRKETTDAYQSSIMVLSNQQIMMSNQMYLLKIIQDKELLPPAQK